MKKRIGYVEDKNGHKRTVVLLQSLGCSWGKCSFCDYQNEKETSVLDAVSENKKILKIVDKTTKHLQVIDSASYSELPLSTILEILDLCRTSDINLVTFEGHWIYRYDNVGIYDLFQRYGIATDFILGLESFNSDVRETALKKGMPSFDPEYLSTFFYRSVNILFGFEGDSLERLSEDLLNAITYDVHVFLNIYENNSTDMKRDEKLVQKFYDSSLYEFVRNSNYITLLDGQMGLTLDGVGYDKEEE